MANQSAARAESGRAAHDRHAPRTVDELLRSNVEAIHRLDVKALRPATATDRLATRVERFAGSATFIWLHVAWFTVWILANTVLPVRHFDPYPFTFLTLVVSLEAIFLAAFILMSQNVSARMSERRDQLDLQINLLSEQENTKMLRMLDSIAKKVGATDQGDPSVKVLEQATQPEQLAQQIDRVIARDARGSRSGRGS
ncbi:MAG TPA: DUF1003 domain-containing protein [Burkholderiaceae bacterium]|jgi:uncharacterized membrane protein